MQMRWLICRIRAHVIVHLLNDNKNSFNLASDRRDDEENVV